MSELAGSALRLILSYFCDRTQRVQTDDIMSDSANLLCGVPQGSVLGPMKLCLYIFLHGAILIDTIIVATTSMRTTPI